MLGRSGHRDIAVDRSFDARAVKYHRLMAMSYATVAPPTVDEAQALSAPVALRASYGTHEHHRQPHTLKGA